MSRNRNRNGGGGGGGRRDAKSMSKNRFLQLDPDIASDYVDEDDNPPRRTVQVIQNQLGRIRNLVTGRGERNRVEDRQLARSFGKNAELINKIRVPRGRVYGERWLVKQLYQQEIPDFKPIMMSVTHKGDIEFFIKSDEAADTIRAINRRIVHQKTGDRIRFEVHRTAAPWSRLSKNDVEIINSVVDSKYDAASNTLDLSEFAMNEKFKQHDMHMMLNKNNVMLAVVERIDEKFGNITALSLKGNRLRYLDYTSMLVHVCQFVSVFDLSDNQIENITQLEKLKGMPVKTLFFEGNPLCEKFTKASDYLNAVQQVFPRVIGLDGQEVPASTIASGMDEDEEVVNEPPMKPCFYNSDENIKNIVETFIVEYMKHYDGKDGATTRKNLIPAYHADNSVFTLTIAHLADSEHVTYHSNELFSSYIQSSHNILQEDKWSKRRASRVFRGAMKIAVQLSDMPITNHYVESFAVDVHLVTPQLLGFTLQGLFEDGTLATPGTLPTLNYFSRSFYVAPCEGGSVVVLSDMLYISAIIPERIARYKLLINKAMSAPPVETTPAITAAAATTPSEDIRRQMIEQFCKDSGMLPDWSLKCLEDSNWNYEMAGQMFMESRQQIPPSAYAVPPQ